MMQSLLLSLFIFIVQGEGSYIETENCQFEESAMLQHLGERTPREGKPRNWDKVIKAYDDYFNLTAPSPELVSYYQDQAKAEYKRNIDYRKNHSGHTRPRLSLVRNADPGFGKVDYVFTWGAPGTGSPGLRPRQGTCFLGTRAWVFTNTRFGQRNDPVAFIANGN
eukprot:TRINITY_DN17383_c0_g1_i2.p1 TRINITY_DN17383_c0_g1~~TRINITY_DN17383_c0_g1_i2.p1  ORF type:complete len:165 (-),score=14.12 TRINITY_DN17383_c0_g1_i2:985-1479(-)